MDEERLLYLQNKVADAEDALENIEWEDTPKSHKFKMELQRALTDAQESLDEYQKEIDTLQALEITLDALDQIGKQPNKTIKRIVHEFDDSDGELDIDLDIVDAPTSVYCTYSNFFNIFQFFVMCNIPIFGNKKVGGLSFF